MQQLIILLIFAVAVGYLGRRMYRSFAKKKAGCGKGCGCDADSAIVSGRATPKGITIPR